MTRHTAYTAGRRSPFASFPHADAARRWLAAHPDEADRTRFVPPLPVTRDEAEAVAYCGNYPDRDHSACPSSVECGAVTLDDVLGPVSPFTGHRAGCTTYATLDAADCDCAPDDGRPVDAWEAEALADDDDHDGGPDRAWEDHYRTHSPSITGVWEADL